MYDHAINILMTKKLVLFWGSTFFPNTCVYWYAMPLERRLQHFWSLSSRVCPCPIFHSERCSQFSNLDDSSLYVLPRLISSCAHAIKDFISDNFNFSVIRIGTTSLQLISSAVSLGSWKLYSTVSGGILNAGAFIAVSQVSHMQHKDVFLERLFDEISSEIQYFS